MLRANTRTWSIQQLERAARESKFAWRDGTKIKKQLQLRKEAYHEVLPRRGEEY